MKLAKLLRPYKHRVRALAYPLQRRIPITLAKSAPRAVMIFDPSSKYGGWIDRVKGMISVYELARLTGRSFHVYAGPTFPLDGLIEPATFDWRIDRSALRWNPLETAFHVSRDRKVDRFTALRSSSRRTLFVETNLDYLPELHREGDARVLWGERYRELFKLSPALDAGVTKLVDESAVAVHARFTSLLGDFRDVVSKVLPEAERTKLLEACLARLREQAAQHRKVIVFSDSPSFLAAAATAAPNIITLPGTPAHLDHDERVKDTLRKTLVDFYVMVGCERVIQLRLGAMYDSNFSRYASFVRGVPFSQITE
jgi:hypothetical protein